MSYNGIKKKQNKVKYEIFQDIFPIRYSKILTSSQIALSELTFMGNGFISNKAHLISTHLKIGSSEYLIVR